MHTHSATLLNDIQIFAFSASHSFFGRTMRGAASHWLEQGGGLLCKKESVFVLILDYFTSSKTPGSISSQAYCDNCYFFALTLRMRRPVFDLSFSIYYMYFGRRYYASNAYLLCSDWRIRNIFPVRYATCTHTRNSYHIWFGGSWTKGKNTIYCMNVEHE